MSEIESPSLTNQHVAGDLREAADLLEEKGASPYRTGAYRRAADTIERLSEPVTELIRREGVGALRALPGIGPSLSAAIEEIVRTGRWSRLHGYRAGSDPIALLRSVPGVGAVLARRIHDALHIETLEELEAAARDGRLERVEGVGAGRALRVRAALEALLARGGGPTKVNAA
ncbi:MAG TPA: helix-hairpin-helix domain-containing protein [Polyangiaceae bacterium]|nr:helix-hairpin-helix domain-containing protein [Polyangiaceae bacterium]